MDSPVRTSRHLEIEESEGGLRTSQQLNQLHLKFIVFDLKRHIHLDLEGFVRERADFGSGGIKPG